MEYNKQNLQGTDGGIHNAIKSENRIYYAGVSSVVPNSSTKTGYETNVQQTKFDLVVEVTVVDPNHLCSSDDDNSKENSNKTEGSAENLTDVEADPVKSINSLFDFDVLNIGDDVILPETDFFDDCNEKFDLGSYVIEESTSLVLPAIIQLTPVKSPDVCRIDGNKDVLLVRKPIAAQKTDTAQYTTTGLNLWKRKNELRNYVESCSESDDETFTRNTKRRKEDNDPSWNPESAGGEAKRIKKVACRPATTNKRTSPASEVQDSSKANEQKVYTVNRQRFGIGRGKDFAALVKLYKPSRDKLINSKEATIDNKSASMTANDTAVGTPIDNGKLAKEMKREPESKLRVQVVNSSKAHKIKMAKDNVKENDPLKNTSDESDFGKFIRSTIKVQPRTKLTPPTTSTKRNKLEMQNRLKQFPERLQILDKFKTVLNERTAQSNQPAKPTVHQMATEKLPEPQQKLTEIEVAEPVAKRSISIHEYLARKSNEGKRKITVQEYLKRQQ